MLTAEFQSGPNLTSKDIVKSRVARLAAVNAKLLARDIVPTLLVVTARHADAGIGSYIKSLNKLGPMVQAEVDVKNVPNDQIAQRRMREANDVPGATLLMVPLRDRDEEARLLAANGREIEGIIASSRFQPSTPLAMVHLAEYGLGHSLQEIDHPSQHIAVVGRGRSVGKPLLELLQGMDIDVPVITDTDDPRQREMLRGRLVTFSGVGKRGLLGAEHFGNIADEDPQRFAVDAGVSRDGKRVYGDIDGSVAGLTGLMYTPPTGAVGPMNAITMLERASFLTAEKAGVLDEFDVAIYSLMGLRDQYSVAA